jgi:hypothetical protein
MARRAERKGGKAKAGTGCNELGEVTVQPGTASSLCPCGGRGRSNAARIRRAAHDRRRWKTGPDGVTADGESGGVTGPGGPSGTKPARSRVRSEVFCQWPAQFVSVGACVCKATDHAHAGCGPLMREQSRSGAPEMRSGAAVLQEAARVCRPCFCSTHA